MSLQPIWRVAGRDAPLAEVVARARRGDLPAGLNPTANSTDYDYAQIDLALAVEPVAKPGAITPPAPGLSFAGFTPRQRGALLAWQQLPPEPRPPAFSQLYLASLEVRLLENGDWSSKVLAELLHRASAEPWARHRGLTRTVMLAAWLLQDGSFLARWIGEGLAADTELGVALGLQALLHTPVTVAELQHMAQTWGLANHTLHDTALTLRLQTLQESLGTDPLAYALDSLDPQAQQPSPWRCQHRELRLQIPQPNLRPALESLVVDLFAVAQPAPEKPEEWNIAADQDDDNELSQAHVIIEFRQSRSEYFPFALRQAQKQRGFAQLLDEDRHIVYRVPFRRNDMRRFWQLWQYVQSWSSTRVYCQGRELERWQIYPYSQYLR